MKCEETKTQKRGRRRSLLLAAIALVLVLTASVGSAMAYFTTYTQAEGGYPVSLGERTRIIETFSNWTKGVTISTQDGSEDVYVRAKAFAGSDYDLVPEIVENSWTYNESDGYYYYNDILTAEGDTDIDGAPSLSFHIENVPEAVTEAEDFSPADFNVVIVYECTPVLYEEDGSTYADWDMILVTGTEDADMQEEGEG